MSAIIRPPTRTDISAMVGLSEQKRQAYERVKPQFWHPSENANECQAEWFASLLHREDFILLISVKHSKTVGFVIGQLLQAPEVYDPGGLTVQIDDFCLEQTETWETTGKQLLDALKDVAKNKGAIQTIVICGHHDESKRNFLKSQNLEIASEWYVGNIKS